MIYLRADTNVEVLVGPAVAVGDGFTPVTSLSLSTADEAEIIKYNATTALVVTSISANTMTAITNADGYYTLDLSTSNTDTEGFLVVLINDDSLILPIRLEFMVVNANVYDSLFAAATTDYLQTDVTQWLGTAAATPSVAGVPEVDLTHVAGATTNVSALATNVDAILTDTADMQPKLGTISNLGGGATIGANLSDIEAQTDDIGAAGAGLSAVPWNAAWDAEVESEATDALNAYDPPTKAELDSGLAGLNDPTAAAIADAVWDEAATGHTDAGKAGEQLWTDVDAILTDTSTTLQGDITAILADTNELQVDDYPTTLATLATTAELNKVPKSDGSTSWNATALAAINAQADLAFTDYDPPTQTELLAAHSTTDGLITTVDGVVDQILSDTGTDGVVLAIGSVSATALATDAAQEVADTVLTRQMTESYHVDGVAPTLAQAICFLISALTDFSISGTTITCKKLDGSTTSATFTLDNDTNPTSRTRAT